VPAIPVTCGRQPIICHLLPDACCSRPCAWLLHVLSCEGDPVSAGTILWHALLSEGERRWDDAFYFAVVTFTTIGYGDLAPADRLAKLFFMVYVFLTLIVQLTVVTSVVNAAAQMVVNDPSSAAETAAHSPGPRDVRLFFHLTTIWYSCFGLAVCALTDSHLYKTP
jgi:hypothetical protein